MKNSPTFELYQKYIIDIQFERAALFKVIKQKYNCHAVLYPGSFIHITPSFFFPHVVYIDQNDLAQKFFNDMENVLHSINGHKLYKQSCFIRFIAQNFTNPLPIMEKSFDLLISLYASGISRACKKYLKISGILLTNNHHDDAGAAASDSEFEFIAVMNRKGDTFRISADNLDEYFIPDKNMTVPKTFMKHMNNGSGYIKNADFYLFKRKLTS